MPPALQPVADFIKPFDPAALDTSRRGIWRYRNLLPELPDKLITLDEPETPLLPADFDGRPVLLKLEQRHPSGSYKARGAVIVVNRAVAEGADTLMVDSSGNTAAATATYAAAAGLNCRLYVPETIPTGKKTHLYVCDAEVITFPTRQQAAEAALRDADKYYYASHVYNPYFLHGIKTTAYELYEQSPAGLPDTVVVPVGSGILLIGLYAGFKDLQMAGLIDRLPRLVGVQGEGCAPVKQIFDNNLTELPDIPDPRTAADGIQIPVPVQYNNIIAALRQTDGRVLTVSDREIIEGVLHVGRQGFYVEVTSGATVAGVRQYLRDHAAAGERVAAVITGSGFKTTDKLLNLRRQFGL